MLKPRKRVKVPLAISAKINPLSFNETNSVAININSLNLTQKIGQLGILIVAGYKFDDINKRQLEILTSSYDFNFILVNTQTKELLFCELLSNHRGLKIYTPVDFYKEFITTDKENKQTYVYEILKLLDLDI